MEERGGIVVLKGSKRVFSFALALILVGGLSATMPQAAGAVGIATPNLAAGANLSGTQVYFGSYTSYTGGDSTGAILWHVVETGGSTATLWTTTNMGNMAYNAGGSHEYWSESDICAWLNGTVSGQFLSSFHTAELAAILSAYGTKETWDYATIDIDQRIVLPSIAEIGNEDTTGTWGIPCTGPNDGKRGFGDNSSWWLRSPGADSSMAAYVSNNGTVQIASGYVTYTYAVRPAFKLDLSSVLFTSAASVAGGKSTATVGSGLVGATAPNGAVKLTVLDLLDTEGLSLTCTDIMPRVVMVGDTVEIQYSGAATGPKKYVSCVITNSGGAVLYYGKLATDASGVASFTVPAALSNGNYTIKLFNEQCNEDNKTDFASIPIEITMTVYNTPNNPDGSDTPTEPGDDDEAAALAATPRPPSVIPKTGDSFPMGTMVGLLCAGLVALVWLWSRVRKQTRQ